MYRRPTGLKLDISSWKLKVVSQGFVTYSNIAKIKFLGVNKQTLKEFGAVDTKVTDEMVKGVLKYDFADIAIAISGVAGPTGGSKSKPVGTVCISIGNNDKILSKQHFFEGDRNQVRAQSAETAIKDTINFLKILINSSVLLNTV